MISQEVNGYVAPRVQIVDIPRIPSYVCVRDESLEIEQLLSENGRFRFVMQPDRCITLYMGVDSVWAVYIAAMGAPDGFQIDDPIRLFLQSDGNLVAVDVSSRLLWSTETADKAPGPYVLAMQNDGDCVLYGNRGVRLWATKTRGWS